MARMHDGRSKDLVMFKINPFLPLEYHQRIRNYMTLKNQGQGHFPLLTLENYCMDN